VKKTPLREKLRDVGFLYVRQVIGVVMAVLKIGEMWYFDIDII